MFTQWLAVYSVNCISLLKEYHNNSLIMSSK